MSLASIAVVLKRHAGNVHTGVGLLAQTGVYRCPLTARRLQRPDHILYFNNPEEALLQQHRIETPALYASAVRVMETPAGLHVQLVCWVRA